MSVCEFMIVCVRVCVGVCVFVCVVCVCVCVCVFVCVVCVCVCCVCACVYSPRQCVLWCACMRVPVPASPANLFPVSHHALLPAPDFAQLSWTSRALSVS